MNLLSGRLQSLGRAARKSCSVPASSLPREKSFRIVHDENSHPARAPLRAGVLHHRRGKCGPHGDRLTRNATSPPDVVPFRPPEAFPNAGESTILGDILGARRIQNHDFAHALTLSSFSRFSKRRTSAFVDPVGDWMLKDRGCRCAGACQYFAGFIFSASLPACGCAQSIARFLGLTRAWRESCAQACDSLSQFGTCK